MRVLFISVKTGVLFIFGCLALIIMLGVIISMPRGQIVTTGSYQISETFPPLVYLPGYENGPRVLAGSAILIECNSSAVLFAKQAEMRRAPASTTKIMTAIVALEKGDFKKVITVSRRAASTPGSSIWLRSGDRLTLAELLKGMLLCSGNDGSIAVAEGVAGSVENFVALMNTKAREIGALKTIFNNPHGLRDVPHYTTALDLALMTRYALLNPTFAGLVKQKSATLQWEQGRQTVPIHNTNRLLWSMEGADGVKTGTTNEAGYCLVASATRDGRQLIAVALNSGDRWGDCMRLLEYGFKEFTSVQIAERQKAVYRLKVQNSPEKSIDLYPRSDLKAVVRKDDIQNLTTHLQVAVEPVKAPLLVGRAYGKIGYQYRSQIVEGVDLVTHHPVKQNWWLW